MKFPGSFFLLVLAGLFVPYLCQVSAHWVVQGQIDLAIANGVIGSLWLSIPFLFAALVIFVLANTSISFKSYWAAALGALLGLSVWYYLGFAGSEHALQAHRWTGAALSIGLLPFTCIPAFLVGTALGLYTAWLIRKTSANPPAST